MDERLLATLGLIWNILNIGYINFCIQRENSELQTSPCDETNPIQTILGLSIALCGVFIGLLLIKRIYNLETAAVIENTEPPINNRTHYSLFQNNTSDMSDAASSEEEEQTPTIFKKIN